MGKHVILYSNEKNIGEGKPYYLKVESSSERLQEQLEVITATDYTFGFFYLPDLEFDENNNWRVLGFMPLSDDITGWNVGIATTRSEALHKAKKILSAQSFSTTLMDLEKMIGDYKKSNFVQSFFGLS